MSETTSTIDLIFKLLPRLKGLTGERRKVYFEKVIRPLFQNVEATHNFYIEIILELKRVASRLNLGSEQEWENDDVSYGAAVNELQAAKDNFSVQREAATGLRFAFRAEAKGIFEEIKWDREKEFVLFVMLYFNDDVPTDVSEEFSKKYVKLQLEEIAKHELGAIIAWDSPSAIIAHQIHDIVSSKKITKVLDHHMKRLNAAFTSVKIAFDKVNRDIVIKT